MPPFDIARLNALLDAILPGNAFVARRLKESGVSPPLSDMAEFTAKVPFTHKPELVADQAAHPPYGSNLTRPLGRYTRFCQTSGTTGRPLAIIDTAESWQWMLENWKRIYAAAGVRPGARIYFAFSFGPFLGFWTAFEAAAQAGCLCIPGGGLSSTARLRAILEHGADVLCCTPTYALRLVETAREEGIALSKSRVKTLIVAGEPGGSIAAVREQLMAGWHGARVVDHYGMTEVGPAAVESPEQPGTLRILSDSYFAEVIRPGGPEPVPEGQAGELVLTPLGRIDWPILRYRTGDLVKWRPCPDGMALEGGIIGRVDDMVVVRGVNLYPSAVDAVVRAMPEIEEYRVDVTERSPLAEVAVTVETRDDTAPERLEREFAAVFALRIPVRRAPRGELPRFEMKARRWHISGRR
jgi:phenylacetate-CoA ligase